MRIKKAIFMIGSIGSGKSYYILKHLRGYKILDSDKIKLTLKGYNPCRPDLIHKESKTILEREFKKCIKQSKSFIYDGTGCNSERLLYRIDKARARGFKIYLYYIVCSLKTALIRNKSRDRQVPEDIIIDKYKVIDYSFKIVSPYCDFIKVINNDKQDQTRECIK